ncbi:MAG: response regulator [Planctomycetaceae bacterium]|nr:response regulator [Planctomycetaceae bacterium]
MTTTPHQILVAEDNPVTSNVLKFNLQRGGFIVHVSNNGQEALNFLNRQVVDLIITDFQMPRMSGLELIQKIRESQTFGQTPIFLCSAKGLELDLDMFHGDYHVQQVFFKPFSPKAIVEAANQLFDRESASA